MTAQNLTYATDTGQDRHIGLVAVAEVGPHPTHLPMHVRCDSVLSRGRFSVT
jgi:hypothetical protein